MKLLIIAGPYEADRIRKSAVAAGFETVAVEPGESLSGWITASRPQLIVMAPQMVHADPALALAKVRSVPRGRVPIFLVGDEADESRMASLSEGFFVRPVSPEALLEHAKAVLAAVRAREATNLGHEPSPGRPLPGGTKGVPGSAAARGAQGPGPGRSGATLRPLVTTAVASAPAIAGTRMAGDASVLLAELDAGIDAFLDAELTDAFAAAPKPSSPPDRDFSAETTANMKVGNVRRAKPVDKAVETPTESAPKKAAEKAPEKAPEKATEKATDKPEPSNGVRARILSRYALIEAGDYFQVLGVSRDATPGEVQRAHDQITGEVGPGAVDSGLAGELGAEIEAIRVVAGEALRILRDDRLRTRYRSRLGT